jgi:hypothetical protein
VVAQQLTTTMNPTQTTEQRIEAVVRAFAQDLQDNGGNRITLALIEGLAVRLRGTLHQVLMQPQDLRPAVVDMPPGPKEPSTG